MNDEVRNGAHLPVTRRIVRPPVMAALLLSVALVTLGHTSAPATIAAATRTAKSGSGGNEIVARYSDTVNAALTWEHRGLREPAQERCSSCAGFPTGDQAFGCTEMWRIGPFGAGSGWSTLNPHCPVACL